MLNENHLKEIYDSDGTVGTPKTCTTCAHRNRSICMVSGYSVYVERRCPSVCGVNFERWTKRQGIFIRIKNYFFGE